MKKKIEYAIFSDVLNKIVRGCLQTKEAAEIYIRNDAKYARVFKYRIISREITYGDWKDPDVSEEADNRMTNQEIVKEYKEKMVGKKYRHFKGNIYIVVDIAIHSESAEPMVIYKSGSDESLVWARPLDMFLSEVDREKYPDVTQKYRFEPLDE